jgi:hypothetical protein
MAHLFRCNWFGMPFVYLLPDEDLMIGGAPSKKLKKSLN